MITSTDYILSWKSKGLSSESIKPPTTSDNSTRGCLEQSTISYTHGKIVNIYIAYELGASSSNDNDPALRNCLFGAVIKNKNTDIEKYKYSGYGIGFDRRSSCSFPGGGFGQNIRISGADMSSSPHIDNKKKTF